MGDIEPFNRLAAMFARLVDVACGEPALTIADTSRAIRLARAMAQTLRDMTAADPAMRARFELAFEANIDWASKFSAFPENAALIAAS